MHHKVYVFNTTQLDTLKWLRWYILFYILKKYLAITEDKNKTEHRILHGTLLTQDNRQRSQPSLW